MKPKVWLGIEITSAYRFEPPDDFPNPAEFVALKDHQAIVDVSKEKVVVKHWDTNQDKAIETTTTLEDIILNPSGFNVEEFGFLMLNAERRKRGLTVYKKNYRTGTYDEVS